MLGKYDFKFEDDDRFSLAFTRLVPKIRSLIPYQDRKENTGSLETFVKFNYDISGLETDVEFISDFFNNYKQFCLQYRFER
jgi:hypothetical protein